MLRDLTKRDWQKMLGLADDQIPRALMLRGTRNLRREYDRHRCHFDDGRKSAKNGLPQRLVEYSRFRRGGRNVGADVLVNGDSIHQRGDGNESRY